MNIKTLKNLRRNRFSKVVKREVPVLDHRGNQIKDVDGNFRTNTVRERQWLDETPSLKAFARENGLCKVRDRFPLVDKDGKVRKNADGETMTRVRHIWTEV